ncbi:hypothetical protein BDN71DRAFT_1505437 [Pleurotus eryngii]|uniref:Endonuclease/exonuclease/phosphatase domain-containing protein n=1 Tax=Pleurotus eryngii TaxID=5323 RepID=A0A9P5ZYD5_PLEER|nr:hypothetical protein BDN71DRAFT_1505437 [Pleurotus eryngii]
MPTIMAGNFNLCHNAWSIPPSTNQQSAEDLLEWAVDNPFSLANLKGVQMRVSSSGQQDSIINLAFFNCAVIDLTIFSSPVVNEDLSFGSDHNALTYTAKAVAQEEGTPTDLGKRLDPGKQKEWVANFTMKFQILEESFADPTTSQDLDHIVEELVKCFTQSTDSCMPDCKLATSKAVKWWNQECQDAVEEVRRALCEDKLKLLNCMHQIIKKAKQG